MNQSTLYSAPMQLFFTLYCAKGMCLYYIFAETILFNYPQIPECLASITYIHVSKNDRRLLRAWRASRKINPSYDEQISKQLPFNDDPPRAFTRTYKNTLPKV